MLTDDELCEISLAYGFGPAVLVGGTSAVAAKPERLLPMLREIERRTLERAAKTLRDRFYYTAEDHIRALIDAQSGEGVSASAPL
jgi:hypothetical protein